MRKSAQNNRKFMGITQSECLAVEINPWSWSKHLTSSESPSPSTLISVSAEQNRVRPAFSKPFAFLPTDLPSHPTFPSNRGRGVNPHTCVCNHHPCMSSGASDPCLLTFPSTSSLLLIARNKAFLQDTDFPCRSHAVCIHFTT